LSKLTAFSTFFKDFSLITQNVTIEKEVPAKAVCGNGYCESGEDYIIGTPNESLTHLGSFVMFLFFSNF